MTEAPARKDAPLVRGVGLRGAVALNAISMIGIGPLITIPSSSERCTAPPDTAFTPIRTFEDLTAFESSPERPIGRYGQRSAQQRPKSAARHAPQPDPTSCFPGTGRSQMAEAYLRALAGDLVDVVSAGTVAADRPDRGVVAAMAEDGLDISAARPKLLDPAIAEQAERIITMGCDVEGVARIDADWGLPDPKGQSPERVREIRDIIKQRVTELVCLIAPVG